MPKDACYKKVKAQYKTFPSARASQAIAKCRKSSGTTRKTAAGTDLKRWQSEKWKDTKSGKPCGTSGSRSEYCRPTKRVSSKTPKTSSQAGTAKVKANQARKSSGQRAKKV